jgi:hypothetical protein
VFTFTSKSFLGSLGNAPPPVPVVAIVPFDLDPQHAPLD